MDKQLLLVPKLERREVNVRSQKTVTCSKSTRKIPMLESLFNNVAEHQNTYGGCFCYFKKFVNFPGKHQCWRLKDTHREKLVLYLI